MDYLSVLRIKHYVKNLLIFAPLFFGLKFFDPVLFGSTTLAFIAFSLTASGVYVINDLFDIEFDRKHPQKKDRPIASGAISKSKAVLLATTLFVLGGVISWMLDTRIFLIVVVYFLINLLYSFRFKHIAIVDVSAIAVGFVLRLFVGSIVTMVSLSHWIIIMTFLLAMFLGFAKRRDDLLLYRDTGSKTRKSIDGYSIRLLDNLMVAMAAVIVVSYIMYTVSPEMLQRPYGSVLYLTTFFVILGIMRYLQRIFVAGKDGSPTEALLQDKVLQFIIFGWIILFGILLYL